MMDHTNIECNLMPFFVSQSTMPMQYCDAGHVLRRSEHSQWQAAWSVKISWRPVLQCVKNKTICCMSMSIKVFAQTLESHTVSS